MRLVTRRNSRRRDRPPVGTTTVRGLAVIAGLLLVAYLGIRAYSGVPGRDYGQLYVSTPVVGNLLPHDSVRIGGARVGQVLGREIGADGRPRLELQIEPGLKVPSDTAVALRASGLLGARYVELIPGRSRTPAAEGATLTGDDTAYTFGLPEALDIFDHPARQGLKRTIDELGTGMLGKGVALNRSIETLGTAVARFDRIVSAVSERGAPERLLPALESAVVPLARNAGRWRRLNRAIAQALRPFDSERGAVRAAITAAPVTAASVTRGLGRGRRLVASLRGLSTSANRVLPYAPQGLRQLSGLLGDGPLALRRTDALLESARPAVPGALRITSSLNRVLPDIGALVEHGRPSLDVVARHGCDIVNLGGVMRSMTGFSQPGTGPAGPLMAFRLQPVMPITTDPIGIGDPAGLLRRDGYPPPCKYLSKPYPQFDARSGR